MEENASGKEKRPCSGETESLEESTVKYRKIPKRRVAYIIFDRKEALNAMTFADERSVREMVAQSERDEEVKVLIFKGEGPCFGTGGHVATLGPNIGFGKSGAERRPSQRSRLLNDKNTGWGFNGSHQVILRCAKPTIAQVHSYCYGAHFHTALCCDFIIAAQNAVFGHPGYRYIGPMYTQVLCILTIK
jgi:enoyl-CoA hydratase